MDLMSGSKAEMEDRAELAASVVAVWQPPNASCNDTKLQINDMYTSACASLNMKVKKGLLSEEEKEDEREAMGEAAGFPSRLPL